MNGNKTNINWYPGHMEKTKKLIQKNYNLIDIVYEIVDARIPRSSKIKNVYDLIGNKPKILIMTKKDLCDMKVTNYWVQYYENLNTKVLLLDLNDPNEYKKIIELTHEMLADEMNKRANKGIINKGIRALVVGIPNVGKSTLINRLAGRKVATTGNKPGITKSISWLKTESDILLLDTPGILWQKFDEEEVALNLASMSAIKTEVLNVDDVAVHIIKKLHDYYPDILLERYGIKDISDFVEVYDIIGKKIGAYRNGEADYDRVSNRVLNDIREGYIKGVTFDRGL
ncbi:MAG: ribosome biogenesis GTPase YlqF [Bacilli bacterium]|nr:ribosome biogenesis GTPase YlqF [Bacilli bacterium]